MNIGGKRERDGFGTFRILGIWFFILASFGNFAAHAVVLVSPGYPDVFSGMTVTLVSLLDAQTATLPDTTTWQVLEGPVQPRSGTGKTFALTITGAGPVIVEVTAHWPTWSRYATWQSLAHTWTLTGSRYVSWTPSEIDPPFSWTLAVEPPMNGAMAWTSDETSLEIHPSSDGTSAGFTRFTPHPTSEGVEVRIAPPGLPLALTPIHRRLTLFELSWAVVNGWTDLPFGQSVHLRARITPEDLGPCSWTVVNLTRLEANTLPANEVKVQRAPRVAVSDAEPARPAPPVSSGPPTVTAWFTPPGGGTLAALCLPLPMSPLQIDHERSTHWVALSDPPWSLPLTMAGRIHAVIPPDTLSLIGTGPGTAMSTRALTPVTGVWQSTLWSPALPGTLMVKLQATWGTTLKTSAPFPVLLAHLGIQAPTQMIVGVPITLWAMGTGLPPGCQYYWKYINLGGQGTFSSTLTTDPWTVWTPTHEGGVCFWVGTYVTDDDGDGYWVQSTLAEGGVNPAINLAFIAQVANQIEVDPNQAGGNAVFVDGLDMNDVSFHQVVEVQVQINPPVAGELVVFTMDDPDDPTTDDPIVDSTGALGNDNRGPAGSLSAPSAFTNAQGRASVFLTVSTFPGDNYHVTATKGALNAQKTLAVWRRVQVEIDSMGAEPPGTVFEGDDLLQGDVPTPNGVTLSNLETALKPAYVKPFFFQGVSNSETPWRYNFVSSQELSEYALGSDLFGSPVGNFPAQRGTRDEKPNFWTLYLLAVYEGYDPLSDNDDPITGDRELGNPGVTQRQTIIIQGVAKSYDSSVIFSEILRDMAAQRSLNQQTVLNNVVLHELGHQFGLGHHNIYVGGVPKDLMWAPTFLSNELPQDRDKQEADWVHVPLKYSPEHINAIRFIGPNQVPTAP